MGFDPRDYYNRKAKQSGFKARAVYKLEAIDQKFHIFDGRERNILDVGCAPGSWIQYAKTKTKSSRCTIIGVDLQEVNVSGENIFTYVGDVREGGYIASIVKKHHVTQFDVIVSDAAPNTTGVKEIDAMRQIDLVNVILDQVELFLSPRGRFVAKVFMGPGFDELITRMKNIFGGKGTKIYKPDASRKQSKEIFVIGMRNENRKKRGQGKTGNKEKK